MPISVHLTMEVEELRTKISKIRRGAKIYVTPFSIDDGDPFTSMGIPCTNPARSSVELGKSFLAHLENFDGEVLWIRTQSYYCLKLGIGEVKDVNVLISYSWEA